MDIEILSTGWAFPECPRWYDDALWFSDIYAGRVVRLDLTTRAAEVVVEYDGHPSGLGFLPDGRLLIADGGTRAVLRREADGGLVHHADLSGIATHTLNDMHVDAEGRAYVGNYGDDSVPPAPPFPAQLALVHPDGRAEAVADDLMFANGMATVDDGRTLLVAETRATPGRLTAFTIRADGTLADRRTFTEFNEGVLPDGIAVGRDGSVWVASPFSGELLHVGPDGEHRGRFSVPSPYAVAVGGTEQDQVLVCSAPTWEPATALASREGSILRVTPTRG